MSGNSTNTKRFQKTGTRLTKLEVGTRIDHYWAKVFQKKTQLSGTGMFPYLKKLIKAGLMLSHGNADVERSLSVNKQAIETNGTL